MKLWMISLWLWWRWRQLRTFSSFWYCLAFVLCYFKRGCSSKRKPTRSPFEISSFRFSSNISDGGWKIWRKTSQGPLAFFKFDCITLSINQKVHSPSQVSLKCGSAYQGQLLPKAQWIRGLSSAYQRNLFAPKVLLDYLRLRSISGLFSSFRAICRMDGWMGLGLLS